MTTASIAPTAPPATGAIWIPDTVGGGGVVGVLAVGVVGVLGVIVWVAAMLAGIEVVTWGGRVDDGGTGTVYIALVWTLTSFTID